MEDEKKPKIRFQEFSTEWNIIKLNEIFNEYTCKTTREDEYPVLSSTMSGIYFQNEYFNQNVSTASNIGYKIVPKGYMTYRSMSDNDTFHFNIQNITNYGIVSPAYPVFKCNDKNNSKFVINYMNENKNFKEQLRYKKEGGTRYALPFSKLKEMDVIVTEKKEQEKIADFISTIDKVLHYNQKKFEKLNCIKKSMLNKMFPNDETLIPKIRFEKLTDKWEKHELGELIQLNGRIGFRGYTQNDIISKEDGGVLTFSPTNILNNQIVMDVKNTYITKEKYDESPEIQIHNNDILFVKTGSSLGKCALVKNLDEPASINPQVVVIRADDKIVKFLSMELSSNLIQDQVSCDKIGGAVPTLTEGKIKKFEIYIPNNTEESRLIGEYFEKLDEVINYYKMKIEKIAMFRSSMLEKMYV